jgi:hypothetical protein
VTRGTATLTGLRVVVDCAHGAASALAPQLLRRAGAEVIAIGAEPDGENINADCGSTHLGALSAAVTKHAADAGIAHDGDADRCLAVDAAGEIIDGDQILAVLALELKARGLLTGDTVVATVMSNLGFRKAMAKAGITVVETAVGDRYVLEAMRAGHFVIGGEQSGHIIMLDHATTGDGMLTALHLLAAAARQRIALADLAGVMTVPAGACERRRGEQGARCQVAGTGHGGGRGAGGTRRGGPRAGPAERHRAGRTGHGRGHRPRARPAPRRRPGRRHQVLVLTAGSPAGQCPPKGKAGVNGRPMPWIFARCGNIAHVVMAAGLPEGIAMTPGAGIPLAGRRGSRAGWPGSRARWRGRLGA